METTVTLSDQEEKPSTEDLGDKKEGRKNTLNSKLWDRIAVSLTSK
jgi:hypothetical protein